MTTTAKTFTELTQHAESIKNNELHDLRGAIKIGDCWAQGDVLIRRIAKVPANVKPVPFMAQLAPGETQGSRHCLGSGEGISMHRLASPGPLEGPVFTAEQDVTVTHPEHGDVLLGPGTYAIEYQRTGADLASERRVLD